MIAVVGSGTELDRSEVAIVASTGDVAHGVVATVGGERVDVHGKVGGEGGVLRYNHSTGVGCDTIVPECEVVTGKGGSGEDGLALVVVVATTGNGTHIGIVVEECNGRIIGEEDGGEDRILCGVEVAGILCVAVAPALEVIVAERSGGDDNGGVVAIESRT